VTGKRSLSIYSIFSTPPTHLNSTHFFPPSRHNFLKSQFELEDRQAIKYTTVFSTWDVEGRGEISVADLASAVKSCGAKLHPQILKV
jgi:hypothetical protein